MRFLATMTALSMTLISPAQAQDVSKAEVNSFVSRIQSCWNVSRDVYRSGLKARLRVTLERDGRVAETEIIDSDDSELGKQVAISAVRAVERCAPYSFSAASYEQWKTLEIDLIP